MQNTVNLLSRTYIETFDDGPGGWIGWNWNGARDASPIEVRDEMAVTWSPWWIDANHAPPGAGYLNILFALHTQHGPSVPEATRQAGGVNHYVRDGYPTDLTNAKVTVRIRGEVQLRGAQVLLLVQGNVNEDPDSPNWVNQVLVAQPLEVTHDWSTQTIQLVPEESQWINLGTRYDRAAHYGESSIEQLLRDVNGDIIFVLFPLDVRPLSAVTGNLHHLWPERDYEVDTTRLPEGKIMLDEVRIEFS